MPSPRPASIGEETFMLHCRGYKLAPEREYRFHLTRMWRFDESGIIPLWLKLVCIFRSIASSVEYRFGNLVGIRSTALASVALSNGEGSIAPKRNIAPLAEIAVILHSQTSARCVIAMPPAATKQGSRASDQAWGVARAEWNSFHEAIVFYATLDFMPHRFSADAVGGSIVPTIAGLGPWR